MTKSNSKTKYILTILLLVCSCFLFSACDFFGAVSVDTPLIYDNAETSTIKWNDLTNATSYYIYINSVKQASINDDNSTSYSFCYGDYITTNGVYQLTVKAINGTKLGTSSNIVTKTIENTISNSNQNVNSLTKEYGDTDILTVAVSSGVLDWNEISGVEYYVVSVFNNSNGINYYITNDDTFLTIVNISNIKSEVLGFRVGVVYSSDTTKIVFDDSFTMYNPISKISTDGSTTTDYSKPYVFDGKLYDSYICSDEELQNYMYYNFIERNDSYDMLLSVNYKNQILSSTSDVKTYLANYLVNSAFRETYAFKTSAPTVATLTTSLQGYACLVSWRFCYNGSCVINSLTGYGIGNSKIGDLTDGSFKTKGITQFNYVDTIYSKNDFTERASDYDSFASDNQLITTNVETSEELYWAVENKVTPIFSSTTSRAYLCYDKAKTILRDIISPDMTDAQKAQAIFDYICIHSVYDYSALQESDGSNLMKYSAYYLEGILLDNNNMAVCDGYSKTYSLLCNMEGINCIRVTGELGNLGGHAWNKVEINNIWYIVDITNTEIKTGSSSEYIKARFPLAYDNNGNVTEWQVQSIAPYEALSHNLFLVSTASVSSYVPFDGRAQNVANNCSNNYEYYVKTVVTTIAGTQSSVVTTKTELFNLWNYLINNNLSGVDCVLSRSLYNTLTTYDSTLEKYTIDTYITEYCADRPWVDGISYSLSSNYIYYTNNGAIGYPSVFVTSVALTVNTEAADGGVAEASTSITAYLQYLVDQQLTKHYVCVTQALYNLVTGVSTTPTNVSNESVTAFANYLNSKIASGYSVTVSLYRTDGVYSSGSNSTNYYVFTLELAQE